MRKVRLLTSVLLLLLSGISITSAQDTVNTSLKETNRSILAQSSAAFNEQNWDFFIPS